MAASAQELDTGSNPAGAQYGDQSQEFSGSKSPDSPPPTDPTASSAPRAIAGLPFTGVDVVWLASGAVVLLATGMLIRRQARARD